MDLSRYELRNVLKLLVFLKVKKNLFFNIKNYCNLLLKKKNRKDVYKFKTKLTHEIVSPVVFGQQLLKVSQLRVKVKVSKEICLRFNFLSYPYIYN